jgi:hypothetical protein
MFGFTCTLTTSASGSLDVGELQPAINAAMLDVLMNSLLENSLLPSITISHKK